MPELRRRLLPLVSVLYSPRRLNQRHCCCPKQPMYDKQQRTAVTIAGCTLFIMQQTTRARAYNTFYYYIPLRPCTVRRTVAESMFIFCVFEYRSHESFMSFCKGFMKAEYNNVNHSLHSSLTKQTEVEEGFGHAYRYGRGLFVACLQCKLNYCSRCNAMSLSQS